MRKIDILSMILVLDYYYDDYKSYFMKCNLMKIFCFACMFACKSGSKHVYLKRNVDGKEHSLNLKKPINCY